MRLFIHNNNKLKYVLIADITESAPETSLQCFLSPLPYALGRSGSSDAQERKKVLWKRLYNRLESVKFQGSRDFLKTAARNGSSKCNSNTTFVDFHADRGTGWCGLTCNHVIAAEIAKGDFEDKKQAITSFAARNYVPLWRRGDEFMKAPTTNDILPVGTGALFHEQVKLSKTDFVSLQSLSSHLHASILALFFFEWPAYYIDKEKLLNVYEGTDPVKVFKRKTAITTGATTDLKFASSASDMWDPVENLGTWTETNLTGFETKIKDIFEITAIAYRQLYFLRSAPNFVPNELELSFLQSVAYYSLYAIEKVTMLIKHGSGLLKLVGDIGVDSVVGGVAGEIEAWIKSKREAYASAGQNNVAEAIGMVADQLASYRLLLLLHVKNHGLHNLLNLTEESINKKIIKVMARYKKERKKEMEPEL